LHATHVCHDPFIRVTRLSFICACDTTYYVCNMIHSPIPTVKGLWRDNSSPYRKTQGEKKKDIRTCTCVYVNVNISFTHIYIYAHTYILVYIHILVYIYIYLCLFVYIYRYTHVYMHIIHTYIAHLYGIVVSRCLSKKEKSRLECMQLPSTLIV